MLNQKSEITPQIFTQVTQAFIFAAGRGERMRPLTDSIPKPLVKIKNKSIIDYIIEKLDKISTIKKIIINGFYLAEQIEEHIKKLNNPKIIFSREVEKVETGGALVFASDKIDLAKPLLTINGDVLWCEENNFSDIEALCKFWPKANCDILLGLKKTDEYFGYDGNVVEGREVKGDFNLVSEKLFRFVGKPMSHAFVGLQVINPKILRPENLQNAPAKCFSMSHFYNSAIDANGLLQGVKGFELRGKYFHIGNVPAIKATERLI